MESDDAREAISGDAHVTQGPDPPGVEQASFLPHGESFNQVRSARASLTHASVQV